MGLFSSNFNSAGSGSYSGPYHKTGLSRFWEIFTHDILVDTHLNYTVLDFWRKWLSISWIVCYVFSLVGYLLPSAAVLGPILAVICAVLGILFIIVFFRTSHRYGLLTTIQ